jgi:hypothetical protein
MKGLKSRFFQHLPAVRPASAGRIGVAPAARFATAAPGGFGSPSAGTNETGRPSVGWTRQGEREETPALGALEKSTRVAEATVLEPKVATMERREARRASQTFAQTA